MKKIFFTLVAALTLVVGGSVAFAGDMGGQGMGNMPYAPSSGQGDGGASQDGTTNSVTIQNFAFSPSSITVPMGTMVTWTNRDNTAHTVTGDTSDGPMSGTLQPGQAYSFTFNKVGTFSYHCAIHPTMKGSVTVTSGTTADGSSGNTTPTTPADNTNATPPAATTSPTNVAYANSSASNTNNIYNNTYASSSKPAGQTSQPTYSQPTTTPAASTADGPTQLPNTGAAGVFAAFLGATLIGTGLRFLWLRAKTARG